MLRRPPRTTRTDTLFPYTTLFRSKGAPMSDDIYDDDDGHEAAPMEMLASYFAAHDWPHEMVGEDEIVATAQGSWTTYELRAVRSEERRVGKECVSTGRSRGSPAQ